MISAGSVTSSLCDLQDSFDHYCRPSRSMAPIGIHMYASHIVRDNSLSVYRKFAVLNTRNILYLQSELADLERQLQRLDAKADSADTDNDIWAIPRSWRRMRDAGISFPESEDAGPNVHESVDPRDSWNLTLKIRRVLKEYSKLLTSKSSSSCQVSSCARQSAPSSSLAAIARGPEQAYARYHEVGLALGPRRADQHLRDGRGLSRTPSLRGPRQNRPRSQQRSAFALPRQQIRLPLPTECGKAEGPRCLP